MTALLALAVVAARLAAAAPGDAVVAVLEDFDGPAESSCLRGHQGISFMLVVKSASRTR